jgi:VanZ family protein
VGAVLVSARTARALGTRPIVAFGLIVGFGIAFVATLTPTAAAMADVADPALTCDLTRLLPPPSELFAVNDTSRNVVLFIPLGMALGSLPASRRTLAVGVLAVSMPVVIEATQLLLPALGRSCQSADVVDNLIGLAIGLGLVIMARATAANVGPRPAGPR